MTSFQIHLLSNYILARMERVAKLEPIVGALRDEQGGGAGVCLFVLNLIKL